MYLVTFHHRRVYWQMSTDTFNLFLTCSSSSSWNTLFHFILLKQFYFEMLWYSCCDVTPASCWDTFLKFWSFIVRHVFTSWRCSVFIFHRKYLNSPETQSSSHENLIQMFPVRIRTRVPVSGFWSFSPDVSSPDRSEFLASDPLLQMWIDTRVWASGLWSFSPDVDRYPGLWFLSGGRGQGDEEEEQLLLFFVSQEKFWWTHSAPAHRIKPGLNLD